MTADSELPTEPPWGAAEPCPHCGADMRPIAWGYPLADDPVMAAADRGEVFLGGCVIPEGPVPQWRCTGCGRDVALPEA